VVEPKHRNRANDRNAHTVWIEASDPGRAKGAEQKPTDEGADDAEDYIEEQAGACASDDIAGYEACDKSQENPGDN
jgi:hypothetical protein